MVEKFEKGEALHRGRWLPVTTFLVVTEWGSEWCCLDGHHDRDSDAVEKEIELSISLLEREALTECPCMGTKEDCRSCND